MGTITVVVSPGAAARLSEARRFVDAFLPTREVLIIGATREAAEDFARDVASTRGATFGLHRLNLFQVAVRLATPALASEGLTPATGLALHAVVTRTAFETSREERLSYLGPIAACPGFPRAVLATLGDARHARVSIDRLSGASPSGPDLAVLAKDFEDELREARLADRADVLEKAIDVLEHGSSAFCSGWPLVLLDTPIPSSLDAAFVRALLHRAGPALVTMPAGDDSALAALRDVADPIEAKREATEPLASVLGPLPLADRRTALPLFDSSSIAVAGGFEERGLSGLQSRLFATTPPRASEGADAATSEEPYVEFFSAPGEGRESVEIARRILEHARLGVPFDRMAVALRSPREYAPLLENAFTRAGIPSCFARGTATPDPAGRALLALLACAAERLSARRFAEYLSLGQVPGRSSDDAQEPVPWTAGEDEVVPQDPDNPEYRVDTAGYRADTGVGPYGVHAGSFASESRELVPKPEARSLTASAKATAVRRSKTTMDLRRRKPDVPTLDSEEESLDGPVRAGSLRTPWRWERLLVDAAVAGGADRWRRRLEGLMQELRARRREAAADESDSPLLPRLDRDIEQLGHVRDFALPIIDTLAGWPALATWREWLAQLEAIVPRVLRQPERVLAVLGDLRPLGAVGPVNVEQVRRVLHERLTELHEPPPQRRYGRVFIGTPDDLRGRVFDLVFVPGLAERVFPQRPRQDPLLLDEARRELAGLASSPMAGLKSSPALRTNGVWLRTQEDRTRDERLLLSIAVGAASRRVCVSYPRMQMADSRPRVPSFYAIDLERARTGAVPDVGALIAGADRAGGARLAWPAPSDPARAIDDIEHDLSVLRRLLHDTPPDESRGRARYLFSLNAPLAQSLRARYVRSSETRWTQFDGLKLRAGTDVFDRLQKHRLRERPYSVSAIQRFAACPYRFFLSAIHRLEPREDRLLLEKLDPLTRGHLFHQVQAETIRALKDRDLLPVVHANLFDALSILDATLERVAAEEHDNLVPAIDRVWHTEIESMGADLHAWLQHMAEHGGAWVPAHVEFGFGFKAADGRDPASLPEPITLDEGWQLHGVVDLIERRSNGDCRVTDHKTGFPSAKRGFVVDGGKALQPLLYAMAVEKALDVTVAETRLFYCTAKGRYTIEAAPLDPSARRQAIEVLEIVDRAVEHAFLPAAPARNACKYCDFRIVCGPGEERRAAHKDQGALGDLLELREMK